MELKRRNFFVHGLLLAVWMLIVVWQMGEHRRVKEAARTAVINRSRDIVSTLSAFIRGLQFRGAVVPERLEPVLNELVDVRTNEPLEPGELIWVALLNVTNESLVSIGAPTVDLKTSTIPEGGLWEPGRVTFEYAVRGATLSPEGSTNPTVVAPPFREFTNNMPGGSRWDSQRREPRPEGPPPRAEGGHDSGPPDLVENSNAPDRRFRDGRPPRRPFWARGMDDQQYQAEIQKRELHGLVLAMSTHGFRAINLHDLWLRGIIIFFSGISALGVAVAWRNLAKSSDLQLRLVRASEMNTHLKEMNLAAAGLAHETRNPLNIIRGMAQMISKQPEAAPEIQERSRAIVNETDKVTAQLNEFINYSRPREVRRTVLALNSVLNEVARALSYDIEEKKIRLEIKGEPLSIEADEQMLRQVLFNLVLNAIQALGEGGEIQIAAQRQNAEAVLEIRDNGPGVPPERRREIFKPYFTTQQKGTGLGLAIVQQIILAHGWEIECVGNEPKGAIFRITHLKLARV